MTTHRTDPIEITDAPAALCISAITASAISADDRTETEEV